MAKNFMDLDEERAMRKALDSLVAQLFSDVDAGKQDEEGAQVELAKFRTSYGFTEKIFKPYIDSSLQRVQAKRMQNTNSVTNAQEEITYDDWPPREPNVSNDSRKNKK